MRFLLVTMFLLVGAPAWACTWDQGIQILPLDTFPGEVPPDVAFSFQVLDTTEPIVIELTDESGAVVDLDEPVIAPGGYPSTYWTATPPEPLTEGHYALSVSPRFRGEDVEFVVSSSATHDEVEASLDLDAEFVNEVDDCGDSTWVAHVEIGSKRDLPRVAYVINEFELADGREVTLAQHPWWGGNDGSYWKPGSKSLTTAVPMHDEPKCVRSTVVLAAGGRVDMGRACDRFRSGGCDGAGAGPSPAALSFVLLVLAGRFRRVVGRRATLRGRMHRL